MCHSAPCTRSNGLLLDRLYSGEELRTLCFALGVDYDDLETTTLSASAKARELVLYLDRRGRLTELVERCQIERPDADWNDGTTIATIDAVLYTQPGVIVAPPKHPLARERGITMARLLREPFVVREQGSDTWQSMADGFGRQMGKLQIAMQIKSTETIKQAVIAGMGISFLSAHTVSRELAARSLAVLDVQGFPLMLHWYVVQRRDKRLPPVAMAFKQFLLSDGARLIDRIVPVPGRAQRRAKTPVPRIPTKGR